MPFSSENLAIKIGLVPVISPFSNDSSSKKSSIIGPWVSISGFGLIPPIKRSVNKPVFLLVLSFETAYMLIRA